jgi:hypothetical protein
MQGISRKGCAGEFNGIAGQRHCKWHENGKMEDVYYAEVCLCTHITLVEKDSKREVEV